MNNIIHRSKLKTRLGQGFKAPRGLRLPGFIDSWHMKMIKLSTLGTD